jgi:KaiC/GvpD/RAD55 family RecA-like ATPase
MSFGSLRFGIATLDELIAGAPASTDLDVGGAITSACISGPDGTGKSVLALHMMSTYAKEAQPGGVSPLLFYVSTDLTHGQAKRTWDQFSLRWPASRLKKIAGIDSPTGAIDLVDLQEYAPFEVSTPRVESLSKYISESVKRPCSREVAFVNLAANTAGDDWTFVNRILAALPNPSGAPHLMVIDAVEGLETFVGEVDAFGEKRSRRSRIAQVMRTAADKCHLLFIIEETNSAQRLPEQFVTDMVIRLRSTEITSAGRNYSRRTIEVEKTRGKPHVRGQHIYVIRDGRGSHSGVAALDANADEPTYAHPHPDPLDSNKSMAYLRVYHSLHYVNRGRGLNGSAAELPLRPALPKDSAGATLPAEESVAATPAPQQPADATPSGDEPAAETPPPKQALRTSASAIAPRLLGFGIRHLDNMLGGNLNDRARGLPADKMTALMGDSGTHKMLLSMAFLADCFSGDNDQVPLLITLDTRTREEMAAEIARFLIPPSGDVKARKTQIDKKKDEVLKRLHYRRLVPQDTPSAVLIDIVRLNIDAAIKAAKSFRGQVRVVIGNLATMRAAYPDIEQDPLFLPTLLHTLRTDGVSALLINSEPGTPTATGKSAFSRSLRGLVDHHLYTWHVPFFGEDRVAIAAIPSIEPGRPPVVRELVRRDTPPRLLNVDPHFEIYKGLYEGMAPELIPLRIWLFGNGKNFDSYLADLNARMDDLFVPSKSDGHIATASPSDRYDELRAFIDLHRDTRLDHTTVVQVDEFWSEGQGVLRQEEYLLAPMVDEDHQHADRAADPFLVFQHTHADEVVESMRTDGELAKRAAGGTPTLIPPSEPTRIEYFTPMGFNYQEALNSDDPKELDRVPYMWDFGFLLLRRAAWQAAFDDRFVCRYSYQADEHSPPTKDDARTIGEIWYRLVHPKIVPSSDQEADRVAREKYLKPQDPPRSHLPVNWRQFLHACSVVARSDATRASHAPIAFDIDLTAPESFSCLVLEIWASELRDCTSCKGISPFKAKRHETRGFGILELLGSGLGGMLDEPHRKQHLLALYKTFLLLGEVVSAAQFGAEAFDMRPHEADPLAVASRHWYSTACQFTSERRMDDPLEPVRLPGNFSVRGDWFLGIASGSRSPRLGHRAIDLLSTRRANVYRLQQGLGLPTREFVAPDKAARAWTRLRTLSTKGVPMWVSYGELLRLGMSQENYKEWTSDLQREEKERQHLHNQVPSQDAPKYEAGSDEFSWLWRYTIKDYDRHARLWLKLLFRVLVRWQGIIAKDTDKQWRSSFELYDWLCATKKPTIKGEPLKSFELFCMEIDGWIEGLRNCTPMDRSEAGNS